jgi:hypothetical protein
MSILEQGKQKVNEKSMGVRTLKTPSKQTRIECRLAPGAELATGFGHVSFPTSCSSSGIPV